MSDNATAAAAQTKKVDLSDVDLDTIIRLIKPSGLPDGSRQIMLPIYNTQVSVKAFPGSQDLTPEQLDEALIALRDQAIAFEMNLSRTRSTSEVTKLNDAQGEWVALSPGTLDLVAKAKEYSEASGGVFDVTMGSVTPLWNFHEGVIPAHEDLDEALRHVDWRFIEVDREQGRARLTDPQARIDLGGIAKGYIADALAATLREHGCDSAFVNLGGNVLTVGSKTDGSPWRIGVRDPREPSKMRAVVTTVNRSVVTSGLYERNFTKDGVFYHHILDPKDGMPVKTDVAGATIVSKKSLDGDGYSTTLFALGVEGALAFVEKHPELEAIIIGTDDQVHITSGLEGRVQLVGRD